MRLEFCRRALDDEIVRQKGAIGLQREMCVFYLFIYFYYNLYLFLLVVHLSHWDSGVYHLYNILDSVQPQCCLCPQMHKIHIDSGCEWVTLGPCVCENRTCKWKAYYVNRKHQLFMVYLVGLQKQTQKERPYTAGSNRCWLDPR